MTPPRIYLSPPELGPEDAQLVAEALASGWIAPAGPQLAAFEEEFAAAVDAPHAVAVQSGTAALHLALQLAGVGPGDEVAVSTLTFAGSVFPIRYLGATPVFVDSEPSSWNLDPALLADLLRRRQRAGRPLRAVVAVHLYGQTADLDAILALCREHGVTVIEDAAEALGATHGSRSAGTVAPFGIFSFNGNKLLTTSGGGMLVCRDAAHAARARKLAAQAREPAPHYEHAEIGYNYRMSNLLAALGRGQLRVLGERVAARRRVFAGYAEALGDLPGLAFMPEAPWGRHARWLTTLTIDPARFGADREAVRLALGAANVEARPVWKPMHQQPVFRGCEVVGGAVADALFAAGLCLPSGSQLTPDDRARIAGVVRAAGQAG